MNKKIMKIIYRGTGDWSFYELYMYGLAYKKNYEIIQTCSENPIPKYGTHPKEFNDYLFKTGIMNLAFSTELLLKSFLLLKGNRKVKGHNLNKLFGELPKDVKNHIIPKIKTSYEKELDFHDELLKNSEMFEKTRYFFEGGIDINLKFVRILNEVLVEEIGKSIDNKCNTENSIV